MKSNDVKRFSAYVRAIYHSKYITVKCILCSICGGTTISHRTIEFL